MREASIKSSTVKMTDLSRSPGKYFRRLDDRDEALLVIKNSGIKYAVINADLYERLLELQELSERYQIADLLSKRGKTSEDEYIEVDPDTL